MPPAAVCVVSWLVPGAGHLMLGRRQKGVIFLVALPAMFAIGLLLKGALPAFDFSDPLVGLAAVTADGATLGTVTAVHNFGAGDLVEIKPQDGGEPLMVPFTETAVPEIDMKARRMVVKPLTETE